MEANIQNAERHAGFKADHKFLLELGQTYRKKRFGVARFPKWLIDDRLFQNYEKVFPPWKKVQPHCLVNLDFDGTDFDVYLPEASLYEDMCFAYNQAFALKDRREKPDLKAHTFYIRATIISAFNFVESFLNGLAFDLIATCRRTLSQAERDLLSEWDSKHKRQRYVKLRDKAIQYPKIVLNRKSPPFTESTCPALAVLMEKTKLRDAVVHSSPKLVNNEVPKIKDLVETDFGDATEVADAAVEFVCLVDEEVHKGKYDYAWLLARSVNGCFPPESFT
ncbi:MAG TPA: hypothetical protein VN310_11030 [Candidatus Dormibacteraeota bacterium]|nr:hypothetical protein [Candidatus Dormibacteraeota bacterium]